MTCPNCKHDLHPQVNDSGVTCRHCATTCDLTPSGHIRRVRIPPHAQQMTREELEGNRT
jgi:hypothetical protein